MQLLIRSKSGVSVAAAIATLILSILSADSTEYKANYLITSIKSSTKFPDYARNLNDGLGVAVRRPSNTDLTRIAALGLKFIRMDLNWEIVEKKRGVFDFTEYRRYAENAAHHGLRIVFILDYGNSIYSGQAETYRHGVRKIRAQAPADRRSIRAFANFARSAAVALHGFNPIWEIWNEPDNKPFWPPEPNVAAYIRMADVACNSIRTSVPSAQIIGPAAASMSFSFGRPPPMLKGVIRSSLSKCLNAFSVHPYYMDGEVLSDSDVWKMASNLRGEDNSIPFANSEWGKSAVIPVTRNDQAAYLVKTLAILLALHVKLNIWYNWRDVDNLNESESNFGLIDKSGIDKPSLTAYKQFTSSVGEANAVQLYRVESGAVVKFTGPGRDVIWVAWSSSDSFELGSPAGLKFSQARDLYGRRLNIDKTIRVTRSPVYIWLSS